MGGQIQAPVTRAYRLHASTRCEWTRSNAASRDRRHTPEDPWASSRVRCSGGWSAPGGCSSPINTFQLPLDLLDARQAPLQLGGQGLHQLVLGDAHRLRFVAEGIFGNHLVPALAQEQPDARPIAFGLDLAIHRSEMKLSWPRCSGWNLPAFSSITT